MLTIQKTRLVLSKAILCGSLLACTPLFGMKSPQTSPKNNAVILWGMHKVLFKAEIPWWVPVATAGYLTNTKIDTILKKVFDKLRPITAEEIQAEVPGFTAQGVVEDGDEPLLVCAWILGLVSNEQAKKIACKYSNCGWFQKIFANGVFDPEGAADAFKPQKPVFTLVRHCKAHGNIVGLSTSFNGTSFDVLGKKCPDLTTLFDCAYVSGKRNKLLLPSQPEYYDEVIAKYPGRAIYLIDNPGTAMPAARQKDLRTIEFDNDQTGALDDLTHHLQREGILYVSQAGPAAGAPEQNSVHATPNTNTMATLAARLGNVRIAPGTVASLVDAQNQALAPQDRDAQ